MQFPESTSSKVCNSSHHFNTTKTASDEKDVYEKCTLGLPIKQKFKQHFKVG